MCVECDCIQIHVVYTKLLVNTISSNVVDLIVQTLN